MIDRHGPGPARSSDSPVTVSIDATPLLGVRTGVGVAVAGMLNAVASDPGLRLIGYGLTTTGWRELRSELPPPVRAARGPMPANALLRIWARADTPPIEWWTGRTDVVHGSNYVVPPARRAARLVTVYDLTSLRYPELCTPTSRRYPELIRRALRTGASVHAVSRSVAEDIIEHFEVSATRVHVIHIGLTPPTQPPPTERVEHGPPYILGLGTIEPRKNFPVLVAAFDRIAGDFPDLHLRIAGPPGWGQDALVDAIASARHRDRIHQLGWVADPASLIAGARIFAFPSLYEGFGFPPLEAMSLGTPVVASTAGSLPEILSDAAVLVSPRDTEGLAGALEAVLSDASQRERLITAGRQRAGQFRWEQTGQQLAALYKTLAGGN